MAALASSLIRQKRAVKDDQTNRPVANKRKPCPKSNKSLCQKQILVLISKVRLCGGRKGRNEKRPGESLPSFSSFPACYSLAVRRFDCKNAAALVHLNILCDCCKQNMKTCLYNEVKYSVLKVPSSTCFHIFS